MIAFLLEPEASAELEHAALWYEGQRSGLGQEFLRAVDHTLELIRRWPEVGHRITRLPQDVPARRAPVNRFPYHVVFLEWQGALRIVALAHDHQEPGYWRSRLNK